MDFTVLHTFPTPSLITHAEKAGQMVNPSSAALLLLLLYDASATLVRVQLCLTSPGAPPCSVECAESLVKEDTCALPRAPSGLGFPAMLHCGNATVNATFFNSPYGECDPSVVLFNGSYPTKRCISTPTLSFAFECVTPPNSLEAPQPS